METRHNEKRTVTPGVEVARGNLVALARDCLGRHTARNLETVVYDRMEGIQPDTVAELNTALIAISPGLAQMIYSGRFLDALDGVVLHRSRAGDTVLISAAQRARMLLYVLVSESFNRGDDLVDEADIAKLTPLRLDDIQRELWDTVELAMQIAACKSIPIRDLQHSVGIIIAGALHAVRLLHERENAYAIGDALWVRCITLGTYYRLLASIFTDDAAYRGDILRAHCHFQYGDEACDIAEDAGLETGKRQVNPFVALFSKYKIPPTQQKANVFLKGLTVRRPSRVGDPAFQMDKAIGLINSLQESAFNADVGAIRSTYYVSQLGMIYR